MSGGAKKAAPREKSLALSPQQYKVTNVPHFINGSMVPVGQTVFLPEGVRPGKHLVPVDDDGNEVKVPEPKEEVKAKDAGK